ncbi:uncharacterized protein [Eurosta solidaginis]|uniref:uncharacterized protein n=1 Tax=Eurosta solidaginis TaxID=178769 RepID=UPI00353140D9
MSKATFDQLLQKMLPLITKRDTMMREAIPPQHRLALTLRFLASGNNFEDLKFLTAISPQTIGKIVTETFDAIICQLKDFIKLPQTEKDWKVEAKNFDARWNFPNCIGAIDGKHVNITKPPGSGSFYYNYKKNFSIILMAVVNANYEFLMVDVGTNGRASDAGLFSETKFFSSLKNKTLKIPDPCYGLLPLPNCEEKLPIVFVADDAFPLLENIMKPFSHNTLKEEETIFNYRLSRARRIVGNCFGILASRFRILLQTINLSPEKVTKIVLTCCYLHNFLRRQNEETYFEGGFDVEETDPGAIEYADWHNDHGLTALQASSAKNASNLAKTTREKYCNYFNTVGAVPWQNNILNIRK